MRESAFCVLRNDQQLQISQHHSPLVAMPPRISPTVLSLLFRHMPRPHSLSTRHLLNHQFLFTRHVCSTSPKPIHRPTREATAAHDLPEVEKLTTIVDFNQPLYTSKLVDRTILVTGGASGLGAAIVLRLSELGFIHPAPIVRKASIH